jgi:hypothetical protein
MVVVLRQSTINTMAAYQLLQNATHRPAVLLVFCCRQL